MARNRDTQRLRLYKWERYLKMRYDTNTQLMTIEQCREFIALMAEHRKMLVVPKVVCGGSQKSASYWTADHKIVLPHWAKCTWVCAHEFAHAIHRYDDLASHGYQFAFTYIDLLARYVYPELGFDYIERDANMFGVKTRKQMRHWFL